MLVNIYSTSIKGFKNDFKKPQGLIKNIVLEFKGKKNLLIHFSEESSCSRVSLFSRCCTTSPTGKILVSVLVMFPQTFIKTMSKKQISKAPQWPPATKWASNKPQLTTSRPSHKCWQRTRRKQGKEAEGNCPSLDRGSSAYVRLPAENCKHLGSRMVFPSLFVCCWGSVWMCGLSIFE